MSILDKILGLGLPGMGESMRGMAGSILGGAEILARGYGHVTCEVIHLVDIVVQLVEIERALVARGMNADDVHAVVDQLLDELPLADGGDDAPPPTRSAAFQRVVDRARIPGDRHGGFSATALLDAIVSELPRELRFLEKPLSSATGEVGPLYEGQLSSAKGALTLAAWDEGLRGVFALAQKTCDERWHSWSVTPALFFITILSAKSYHDAFKARGVDPLELLRDVSAAFAARKGRTFRKKPPPGHLAGLSPGLFALILRAERYAAEDATDVKLRHVLAAIHDVPLLAPFVERLAG